MENIANINNIDNINVAVIRGTITNDATVRSLPAGTEVAQFDVSTAVDRGGRTVNASVPIALHEPTPAVLATLVGGTEIVVVGRVERRFFRSGGSTQSRTEVVAEKAVPARRSKTARSLISAAAAPLLA